MDSASLSLLLLLLLLSLTSSLLHPVAAVAADTTDKAPPATPGMTLSLNEACSKTKFPDLCVSSIQTTAPDAKTLDHRMALKHAITAVQARIQDALKKATNNKDSQSEAPPAELSYCVSDLNDAMDDIEKAQIAVNNDDATTAIANLDSLGNNINSCRDELVPIREDAESMYQLLQNCWSLYDLIWS